MWGSHFVHGLRTQAWIWIRICVHFQPSEENVNLIQAVQIRRGANPGEPLTTGCPIRPGPAQDILNK